MSPTTNFKKKTTGKEKSCIKVIIAETADMT